MYTQKVDRVLSTPMSQRDSVEHCKQYPSDSRYGFFLLGVLPTPLLSAGWVSGRMVLSGCRVIWDNSAFPEEVRPKL